MFTLFSLKALMPAIATTCAIALVGITIVKPLGWIKLTNLKKNYVLIVDDQELKGVGLVSDLYTVDNLDNYKCVLNNKDIDLNCEIESIEVDIVNKYVNLQDIKGLKTQVNSDIKGNKDHNFYKLKISKNLVNKLDWKKKQKIEIFSKQADLSPKPKDNGHAPLTTINTLFSSKGETHIEQSKILYLGSLKAFYETKSSETTSEPVKHITSWNTKNRAFKCGFINNKYENSCTIHSFTDPKYSFKLEKPKSNPSGLKVQSKSASNEFLAFVNLAKTTETLNLTHNYFIKIDNLTISPESTEQLFIQPIDRNSKQAPSTGITKLEFEFVKKIMIQPNNHWGLYFSLD